MFSGCDMGAHLSVHMKLVKEYVQPDTWRVQTLQNA